MAVSDWYIINLIQGWFTSINFEALLALLEEETVPCAVLRDYHKTEDNNETLHQSHKLLLPLWNECKHLLLE